MSGKLTPARPSGAETPGRGRAKSQQPKARPTDQPRVSDGGHALAPPPPAGPGRRTCPRAEAGRPRHASTTTHLPPTLRRDKEGKQRRAQRRTENCHDGQKARGLCRQHPRPRTGPSKPAPRPELPRDVTAPPPANAILSLCLYLGRRPTGGERGPRNRCDRLRRPAATDKSSRHCCGFAAAAAVLCRCAPERPGSSPAQPRPRLFSFSRGIAAAEGSRAVADRAEAAAGRRRLSAGPGSAALFFFESQVVRSSFMS
ncbi:hypothetical protein CDD83_9584 [Cordyceps sp. RAO-2017]|nr:hypothetical protein CDD83_9584 [Cordyceps sp. RAO-2017]